MAALGHLLFFALHAAAAFVTFEAFLGLASKGTVFAQILLYVIAGLWLLVCVPLHLVFSAVTGSRRHSAWTHVRCPRCDEPVSRRASVCPHCRAEFDPESLVRTGKLMLAALRYSGAPRG